MRPLLALSLLFSAASPGLAARRLQVANECPSPTGSIYTIVTGSVAFADAKTACEELDPANGSVLTAVRSEEEFNKITALMDEAGASDFWIGVEDVDPALSGKITSRFSFVSADQTGVDFVNAKQRSEFPWGTNQPNGDDDNCVTIRDFGSNPKVKALEDRPCTQPRNGYICSVSCLTDPPTTSSPSKSPTKNPTLSPTKNPTKSPTTSPTKNPTKSPTTSPTKNPTKSPTTSPTKNPTKSPTTSPTKNPTKSPTTSPTISPTTSPTVSPTKNPTSSPTTAEPTISPIEGPTRSPTTSPTLNPTKAPTAEPTTSPTPKPTTSPTPKPTESPVTPGPTTSPQIASAAAAIDLGMMVAIIIPAVLVLSLIAIVVLRRNKRSPADNADSTAIPVKLTDDRTSGGGGGEPLGSYELPMATAIEVAKFTKDDKSNSERAYDNALNSPTRLVEPGNVVNAAAILQSAEKKKKRRKKSSPKKSAQKPPNVISKTKSRQEELADEAEFEFLMANNGKRPLSDKEKADEELDQILSSNPNKPEVVDGLDGARPQSMYLQSIEKQKHKSIFRPSSGFLSKAKRDKAMAKAQAELDAEKKKKKRKKKKKDFDIDNDI